MESPIAIANFFIQKSFDTGQEITPMKVLKLVYLAHGWNLGLNNQPLINEAVQAWKYGPVVESVYREFKNFGNQQITSLGTTLDIETFSIVSPKLSDEITVPLLEKVWQVYGKYNGLYLSTLTHQSGTPWDIVWNKENGSKKQSAIIRNELIQTHYKEKLVENASK